MIKCVLSPIIALHEISAGRSPCDGCHIDRKICGGEPEKDTIDESPEKKTEVK